MDDQTKEQFRWKFYRLVLQLNAIILLVALLVMAVLKAPEPYRIALIVLMVVLVAFISVNFTGKYRETRAWLGEQADKKKPE